MPNIRGLHHQSKFLAMREINMKENLLKRTASSGVFQSSGEGGKHFSSHLMQMDVSIYSVTSE